MVYPTETQPNTTLIIIRSDEIMSSTIRYLSHITFVSVYWGNSIHPFDTDKIIRKNYFIIETSFDIIFSSNMRPTKKYSIITFS